MKNTGVCVCVCVCVCVGVGVCVCIEDLASWAVSRGESPNFCIRITLTL